MKISARLNPLLMSKLPYDGFRDFQPISRTISAANSSPE